MTPLSEFTTLRLGGPARRLTSARTSEELVAEVAGADAAGEPLLLLAGGSNLVVSDDGFPGAVVRVATRGVEARDAGDRVLLEVEAGEDWDALVERCVEAGLAGFECLSGIPGSVGATPIQNVGAYGQEVSETVVSVRVHDRRTGATVDLDPDACGFGYRTSVFKRNPGRWVVLRVTFGPARTDRSAPIRYPELARALGVVPGERVPLMDAREAVLSLRRAKGMVVDPADPDSVSAGSFFTNPVLEADAFDELTGRIQERLGPGEAPPAFPQTDGRVKTSAAWLIERAGFPRGYGDPETVAISSKHTLALTNRGRGTTAGLLALAREIADEVQVRFGVALEPEPVLVGHSWRSAASAAGS